ncbi:hypothetical protein BB561_004898 [Smittium simulii]|uniref:GPI-anchored wall transfer protein n=1 Tax=Smittium simulii TaxID=133385 RepID=A0A2T9YDK7_9FUNG|nr:hypothetical protein BB561_004898 [Smittium simulii]
MFSNTELRDFFFVPEETSFPQTENQRAYEICSILFTFTLTYLCWKIKVTQSRRFLYKSIIKKEDSFCESEFSTASEVSNGDCKTQQSEPTETPRKHNDIIAKFQVYNKNTSTFYTLLQEAFFFVFPIFLVFTNFRGLFITNLSFSLYALYLYSKIRLIHASDKESLLQVEINAKNGLNRLKNGSNSNVNYIEYINVYRAIMMLMTCFSILAVDFPIYPRRFRKTHDYGVSLMDIGVGCFVFASGAVGYRSFCRATNPKTKHKSIFSAVSTAFNGAKFVLALGLFRLILTKLLNYGVDEAEYGVHWNFFFTLGILPIAISLVYYVFPRYSLFTCICAFLYQIVLVYGGLENYIMSAERTHFISANREGIFSLFGYLFLYFCGLRLGQEIFVDQLSEADRESYCNRINETNMSQTKISNNKSYQRTFCLRVFLLFMAFFMLFVATQLIGWRVSRRSANTPYILLVAWINTLLVWSFIVCENLVLGRLFRSRIYIDKLQKFNFTNLGFSEPNIMHAINYNGLFVFLVANILTGLVNLGFRSFVVPNDTRYASYTVSFLILFLYMSILVVLSVVLAKYQIRIR